VDLVPVKPLQNPVTLDVVKPDESLAGMPLLRNSRLSVQPVTAAQFQRILKLGKTAAP
jgi:predicted RNA-binding protein with PUA-like domain